MNRLICCCLLFQISLGYAQQERPYVLSDRLTGPVHFFPADSSVQPTAYGGFLFEYADRYEVWVCDQLWRKVLTQSISKEDSLAKLKLLEVSQSGGKLRLFFRVPEGEEAYSFVDEEGNPLGPADPLYRLTYDLLSGKQLLSTIPADNRSLGMLLGTFAQGERLTEIYFRYDGNYALSLVSEGDRYRLDTLDFPKGVLEPLLAVRNWPAFAWERQISRDLFNQPLSIFSLNGQVIMRVDEKEKFATHVLQYDPATGTKTRARFDLPAHIQADSSLQLASVTTGTYLIQAAYWQDTILLQFWDPQSGELVRSHRLSDQASWKANVAKAHLQRTDLKLKPATDISVGNLVKKVAKPEGTLFVYADTDPNQPLRVWVGVHQQRAWANWKIWGMLFIPAPALHAVGAIEAAGDTPEALTRPLAGLLAGGIAAGLILLPGDVRSFFGQQILDRNTLAPVKASPYRLTPGQEADLATLRLWKKERTRSLFPIEQVFSSRFSKDGKQYLLFNAETKRFWLMPLDGR